MLTVIQAIVILTMMGSLAGFRNAARVATDFLMSDNEAHRAEELISFMTQPLEYLDLAEQVRRATDGDEKAMEALYHRFKTPVFNLARRYTGSPVTAEDVLQDVFVAAFTRLADLREAARFPGWLFRVAVNTSLAYVRSSKAHGRGVVPIHDVEGCLAAPGGECAAADERVPLERAVRTLPPRLKTVFILHDVEGFKHEEISDMLGCTVGTSKSNLFKARMKLRCLLTETVPAPVVPPEPCSEVQETKS